MEGDQAERLILVLLLHHYITVCSSEMFKVLGPADPVVAVAGEDVVLPCYLKPNISAENFQVQWFRRTFRDSVHLYEESVTINKNQIPSYRRRTALFPEELKKGNISLKLSAVRGSDGGRYTCYVQSEDLYDDWSVYVIIKGTRPVISTEGSKGGGTGFLCEFQGWFPGAEVIWLDSEGHSLTAEPTETHRSEDGSISLRRRVIVQQSRNNRLICQIQQQQLGLMGEVDIEVPVTHLCPGAFGLFTLGVVLIIILLITEHQTEFRKRQRCAVDVTLDPDTAHPKLILSEDGKQVRRGDTRQDLPDNPERFTWWRAVLGREGFTAGRHYWEVQVPETGLWTLGAVRESVERKEYVTPCPSEGYWCIEQYWSEYWALNIPPVPLHLRQEPQKVGVYVDYEGGQVSFYSVEDKTHIYTYSGQEFTEKLYPYFLNYESSPLIITPVCY